jgi:hypothetical protein
MWTVKVKNQIVCQWHDFKVCYRFAAFFKGSLTYSIDHEKFNSHGHLN